MSANKKYIGNFVCVEWKNDSLILTTEIGEGIDHQITQTIILPPEQREKLMQFITTNAKRPKPLGR